MASTRSRLLVDITPLRESRDFRLLYLGQLVSATGSQLTTVAAPIQVYQLTSSSLAVGLLGLAQLGPLILGSLVGGALADAHDRRRMLLVAQALLLATSAGLALNAFTAQPRLWVVYLLTGLQAAFSGLDSPTRSAAVPMLVRRAVLPSALALNQLLWQTCQVVGPAVAGVLIDQVSVTATYVLDAATFVVSLAFLALVRPLRPAGGGTRASRASVLEGLRYLRGKQALQGTFAIDINAMVFGMPRAIFPELGTTVFGGTTATGLLFAAPAAGALLAALTSGWLARVRRQGRAVVVAVVAWGAAIAVFGLASWLPLALVLLAVAGAADVVSAVFRNSILQLTVPDRLRGRLSAVHIAVVTGGPRLGDVEAGTVAALVSPQFSVVSGGLACVAGAAAIARLMPALPRWTVAEHGHVLDDEGEAAEAGGLSEAGELAEAGAELAAGAEGPRSHPPGSPDLAPG